MLDVALNKTRKRYGKSSNVDLSVLTATRLGKQAFKHSKFKLLTAQIAS
jgi:hypothetical protein